MMPQKGMHDDLEPVRISVLEVQKIKVPGYIMSAGDVNGALFIYCDTAEDNERYEEIHIYKTGQSFKLHPSELRYVGLNKIWIKQELGMYTFVVRKDKSVFGGETHEGPEDDD